MKIDLTGRTALVTGATAGIGLATARMLRDAGATVVLNGRRSEKVEAALADLGSSVRGQAIDIGTAEGCRALIKAEPGFDIVISNLGIFRAVDFFEASDDVWTEHWETNVMAGVRLARAYLPGMAERGRGRFVFVGSESGYNIPAALVHYGVTKTADISLARGLAKRMAGTGVTVNSVIPGPTVTDGAADVIASLTGGMSVDEFAAGFTNAYPGSLIQRMATAEEVASLIVYLASDQASATTGAALRVDGGIVDFIT